MNFLYIILFSRKIHQNSLHAFYLLDSVHDWHACREPGIWQAGRQARQKTRAHSCIGNSCFGRLDIEDGQVKEALYALKSISRFISFQFFLREFKLFSSLFASA